MKFITKLTVITLGVLFALNSNADKLIFASELIRHGERTPHVDVPSLPNEWKEGVGQLTKKGILQEHDLGVEARKKYIDQYKLLDNQYNTKNIYVRSSAFDRTLMSADAFLRGMFPSPCGQLQPFAIHSKPHADDSMLVGYDYYNDLILKTAKTNRKLDMFHEKLDAKYQKIAKIIKSPMPSLKQVAQYGDALYIRKEMNKTLPEGLSEEDINTLYNDSRTILALALEKREIGALTAHELLKDIEERMVQVTNNSSDAQKFVLYSGHEVTIISLLSALGAPLEMGPPYASHVSVMLFDSEQADNNQFIQDTTNYYVKLEFNNQAVSLPGCVKQISCSLSEFNKLVNKSRELAKFMI